MAVNIDTRSIVSPGATEIFITSTPQENAPFQEQAREIFAGISDVLGSKKASILQERIFSTQAAAETLRKARAEAYGAESRRASWWPQKVHPDRLPASRFTPSAAAAGRK